MLARAYDNTGFFGFFSAVDCHIIGFRTACGKNEVSVSVQYFQNVFARRVQNARVFKRFFIKRRRIIKIFHAVFFKGVYCDFVKRRSCCIVKINHFFCLCLSNASK